MSNSASGQNSTSRPTPVGVGVSVGTAPLRLALDPNGHGLVLSSHTAAAVLVCLEPGGSSGTIHALPGTLNPKP